ncbi:MAG: pyridoxal-phosphate dependent enzyme [bacterium]|nr:pyridoxal-phosphate dependent enzyme [bacterium]
MSRIITKLNHDVLRSTARRCRERGILIPTFRQLRNPETIPAEIQKRLPGVGLWDVNPLNLFRITWKNDMKTGRFGAVNRLEIPREITGVRARIVGMVGKYFPTGAHKVGAAFGCLAPRLVSGNFDPRVHKAVWPSTGNYCRGGAFDCALLGCTAIAILPAEMSQERFTWLREIGAEVIVTPGCESNVKEIYDKCHELRRDPANIIFNQFEEFGNSIYHYQVTGPAIAEVVHDYPGARLAGYISATGSAGTIAAGDYLKKHFAGPFTVATEALQCPTLYMNGFGGHRIEGIGDKHVPWVHNVRNTDAVAAIDDDECLRLLRLFNEEAGLRYLESLGVNADVATQMPLLGISSICNLLAAIKAANYFELSERDLIVTMFTDSAEMYASRVIEQREQRGAYTREQAALDHAAALLGQKTDFFRELNYRDRKAIHNLKYYTWVEQQGKTYEEILEQWNPEYWESIFEGEVDYFDQLIEEFNAEIARGS